MVRAITPSVIILGIVSSLTLLISFFARTAMVSCYGYHIEFCGTEGYWSHRMLLGKSGKKLQVCEMLVSNRYCGPHVSMYLCLLHTMRRPT